MSKNHKRGLLPCMAAGVGLITACVVYAGSRAQPIVHHTPLLPAPAAPSRQAMPEKERFAVIVGRPLFSIADKTRTIPKA